MKNYKTISEIEIEAIEKAQAMTVVGEYRSAYATHDTPQEVVRAAANGYCHPDNIMLNRAEEDAWKEALSADCEKADAIYNAVVDELVAECDLFSFDGDAQDFYVTKDREDLLSISEGEVSACLDSAKEFGDETIDVDVWARAAINGGYKYVKIDTVEIAITKE